MPAEEFGDDDSTAPVRRTLSDAEAETDLDRFGFAVVRFADDDLIDRLRAIAEDVGPAPGDSRTGYFAGCESTSVQWKRSVVESVQPLVAGRIEELFDRHHVYFNTFLTKWPGADGLLPLHQDPTMVDGEGRVRGVTLWCPLLDHAVDGDPGMLRIVPGSHRLPTSRWRRARGHAPRPFDVDDAVIAEFAETVSLGRGDAVVFDHRVLHHSPPNSSSAPRVVLALALRPEEVSNVNVECDPDGRVTVCKVDDDFYIENPPVFAHGRPIEVSFDRRVPEPVTGADLEDLLASLGSARPSSGPPNGDAAPWEPRRPLRDIAGRELTRMVCRLRPRSVDR